MTEANTKNKPLLEEVNETFEDIKLSDKASEVRSAVFEKFRLTADARNLNFENFDGDNLITYIEDSVRRYITNKDLREDIEDWQARVHDQITRNKVTAVLGKAVNVLPIAQLVGRGDEDVRRVRTLDDLYQYSEDVEDYKEFMVSYLEEAIVKGTVIGYEGHEKKIRVLKNIKNSGDEIKQTDTIEESNRLTHSVVKLENFYPSSVGVRRIKDMPYCFVRYNIPLNLFRQDYAMYSKTADVQPQSFLVGEEDRPTYLDFISNDVAEGNVEIIKYYNKDTDEFIILANGIWLNPIMIKEEEIISGIPFNHKELPFFDLRYESFGNDFFYGKSLPDKLKSMQDVLNVLTNMLLDQSFLTIFPPLLTNGFDSIEDDYLRPGRRTPIDTQGLSIRDSFMKLDLGTPSGWHQFILQYTRGIMEESSVDKVSQGVAGQGDRTTAQEIRVAAAGVASMLGLFGEFVKYSIKRKAMLRSSNILQIWTSKNTPIIEKIMGEGGAADMTKAFNIIEIDSTIMTSGKRGRKVIEMYADENDMPSPGELKAREVIFEIETGQKIEVLAIPAEYIRDLSYDVKIIVNPVSEETQENEKALILEKARVYMSFFPNLVNVEELAAQIAEKFGDDPTKMLKQSKPGGAPEEGLVNAEQDQGLGMKPQGNVANNISRGLRSGERA